MVRPPNTSVVNRIIINVVVIMTCLVSFSNSKCKLKAYAIAPLNPA